MVTGTVVRVGSVRLELQGLLCNVSGSVVCSAMCPGLPTWTIMSAGRKAVSSTPVLGPRALLF